MPVAARNGSTKSCYASSGRLAQVADSSMRDYGIIGRMMARWIRRAAKEPLEFEETCLRLAVAQPRQASPILLWGEGADEYRFALVAPLRVAPGKRRRWPSWGLAPAVAAYRQFGVPAYLGNGFGADGIWLHGRRIAECLVEEIGECVLVASSFLMQFPAKCVATPSAAFEQAFRLRLEAQHGWQFEHSWPSEREMLSYAVA